MEPNKMPLWIDLMACQIHPQDWCIPVETIWRRHGWKPPSKECPETIAKQLAFRTWSLTLPAGESQSIPQLPAQESHHG